MTQPLPRPTSSYLVPDEVKATSSSSTPIGGRGSNGIGRDPTSSTTGRDTADWRDRAACQDRPDLDWVFFPANGLVGEEAIELCGSCPVFADCLKFAVDTRQEGIWAATNDDDRREMRGQRPKGRRGTFYTPENVAKRHLARLEARRQRDRRVEAVRDLHGQGLYDREIAERLGISPRHVKELRAEAGLPSQRATQAIDMGQLRLLNELGYNDVEVAGMLGVVPECVRKRRIALGLPARGRKTVNRAFRNGGAA